MYSDQLYNLNWVRKQITQVLKRRLTRTLLNWLCFITSCLDNPRWHIHVDLFITKPGSKVCDSRSCTKATMFLIIFCYHFIWNNMKKKIFFASMAIMTCIICFRPLLFPKVKMSGLYSLLFYMLACKHENMTYLTHAFETCRWS